MPHRLARPIDGCPRKTARVPTASRFHTADGGSHARRENERRAVASANGLLMYLGKGKDAGRHCRVDIGDIVASLERRRPLSPR
jgi:hypothetical protein